MNKGYRIEITPEQAVKEIEELRAKGGWSIKSLNSAEGRKRILRLRQLWYLLNRDEILERQYTIKKLTKEGKRKKGEISEIKVPLTNTKLLEPLKAKKPLRAPKPNPTKEELELKKINRSYQKQQSRERKAEEKRQKFLEEFNKKFPSE